MILIIKNESVQTEHADHQLAEISDGRYGDAEVTWWDGKRPADGDPDPRHADDLEYYRSRTALMLTDAGMARGVEDLIEALRKMGIDVAAHLPAKLAERIAKRAAFRAVVTNRKN